MAQHLLDHTQIGSTQEKMGGKRMTKQVRMHGAQAGAAGTPAHDLLDAKIRKTRAFMRHEERGLSRMVADQRRPATLKVALQAARELLAHRHQALSSSFGVTHQKRAVTKVHIR